MAEIDTVDDGLMGNTYITNTGLGDTQYTGIMGGIGGVQSTQNTGFADTQQGFTDLNAYLGDKFQDANDLRFDYAKANANAQQFLNDQAIAREGLATDARTQMGTDISDGFDTVGGRFDAVDTNVGNVQSAVDKGFVEQETGFADAQINREFALNANKRDRKNNFDATLLEMGANNDEQNKANQLVLEGQTGIGTTLSSMGTAADTYATQSLENQGNIQSGIDTAKTQFDTYIDRYSDDQTLAQKTRADMQLANSNAQGQIQNQLQTGFNQNFSAQNSAPASQVDFANQQAVNYENQRATYKNNVNAIRSVQNQLASGSGQLDGTKVRAVADMAQMASTQTDLSFEQRQEFYALGSAFDENGQLIQNGIDGEGYTIQRSIDASGNMIINTFNAAGQTIGMGNVNLNNAMQRLSDLPMIQGSNAQMGNLPSPSNYGPVPGQPGTSYYQTSLGPSGDGFISPRTFAQTQ